MERCVIPDDSNMFVWVFKEKLVHGFQYFFAVLPGCLVEMTFVVLLVQEADVALGICFTVHLNDGAFALSQPTLSDDGLLLHLYFIYGKYLPVVTTEQGLYLCSDAVHPLKTTITAITQLAASYLSKVLPGGIGGAGLNVRYLTRAGMDPTDVSAVMATQGIVGFVMFIVPVALFLFMRGGALGSVFSVQVPRSYLIIGATVLALACIVLASVRAMRERVRRVVQNFLLSLRDITSSPRDVTMAAMASFGVTVAYILCLFAALRLAGLSLGVTQVVLVYITAIIAKSAIPTPGGLGPLEISMVASLATFGVDKGAAFAAVVLYRLATYWLPIPLSLLAYKYLGKKKYI